MSKKEEINQYEYICIHWNKLNNKCLFSSECEGGEEYSCPSFDDGYKEEVEELNKMENNTDLIRIKDGKATVLFTNISKSKAKRERDKLSFNTKIPNGILCIVQNTIGLTIQT